MIYRFHQPQHESLLLTLRRGRCGNTLLALEFILGNFSIAELSELVGAERLGSEALSPTGAAIERPRPRSTDGIHGAHRKMYRLLRCTRTLFEKKHAPKTGRVRGPGFANVRSSLSRR